MNHTNKPSIPTPEHTSAENPHKKPKSIPLVATIFAFAAIVVVLLIARFIVFPHIIGQQPDYLQQFSLDTQQESACENFMEKLPDKLLDYNKDHNTYISSIPNSGKIQIRCGIAKPAELTPASHIHVDNNVKWFNLSSQTDPTAQKSSGLIWITTDRPMYIAVWIPADAPTGPIQDLSNFIAQTLPATK